MASTASTYQSQLIFNKPHNFSPKNIKTTLLSLSIKNPGYNSWTSSYKKSLTSKKINVVSATAAEQKPKKRYPGEAKGFVEEMRFVAMKLHTKDQAKEGEKEPQGKPVAKWEPSVEGYLKFLVDSKLVYDTLEGIIVKAEYPECKFCTLICFIGYV